MGLGHRVMESLFLPPPRKLTFHSLHPTAFQGPPALAFLPLTTLRYLISA